MFNCEHTAGEEEVEVARIAGSNFDLVTYEHRLYCMECGTSLMGGGRYVIREPKEGYIDVDQQDGRSPARWGT